MKMMLLLYFLLAAPPPAMVIRVLGKHLAVGGLFAVLVNSKRGSSYLKFVYSSTIVLLISCKAFLNFDFS
jgi:hypothetical protein